MLLDFFNRLFKREKIDLNAMLKEGAIIIDVRSPQEFRSGHARHAVNIPLGSIPAQVEKIRKHQKPIITCCASGIRSARAASQLRAANIQAVNGGAWQKVERAQSEH